MFPANTVELNFYSQLMIYCSRQERLSSLIIFFSSVKGVISAGITACGYDVHQTEEIIIVRTAKQNHHGLDHNTS